MTDKNLSTLTKIVIVCGFIVAMMTHISGCQKKPPEPITEKAAETQIKDDIEDTTPKSLVTGNAKIEDMQTPVAAVNDWPWWRGPGGDNVCQSGQNPPVKWGENKNILWQVELPGKGHGTPCIYGDRIYLASGDKAEKKIWMNYLDRETGKSIGQDLIYSGEMAKIHDDNSYASAMPACDGERVYFPYQTDSQIRLVALSMEEGIIWDKLLSDYTSIQGFSASPIFYKSAVIVTVDGKENNKLTALHRKNGELIWQADVPGENESYASAMLFNVAGRYQIILVGPNDIFSYDPDTGENIWKVKGPALCYVASAVADETTVYVTGGYPKKALLAIKADGTGDVTDTHVLWKSDDKSSYVPSPLLHEGLLYNVNDKGLFRCYRARTGEILWEEQIEGGFYSSPVLVNDKLYLFDKKGKGYVCRAGEKFEILANNDLPHGSFSTPVITDNRIYLRTLETLYCLSESN